MKTIKRMIRFIFPHDRAWANTIVLLTFVLYGTSFFFLHQRVGLAVASLAAIPVAGSLQVILVDWLQRRRGEEPAAAT